MRSIEETINALKNGEYDDKLTYLYSCDKNDVKKYSDRYIDVINGFEETFGKDGDIALFSAPGRTEIGGNHTDHQHKHDRNIKRSCRSCNEKTSGSD